MRGRSLKGSARWHPVRLAGITLVVTSVLMGFCAQSRSEETTARSVMSIGLTVGDMERSIAFYRDVLQFDCVSDEEMSGDTLTALTNLPQPHSRVVRMRLGDEILILTQWRSPRGRPMPEDSRSNDLWFQHVAIIVRDMDDAYARLQQSGVRHASSAPQRLPDWNPAAGGIEAFYFRDPDGHYLEILHFPPDKGNQKWQQPTSKLFLGIDHTAIVVSNTDASLSFYRGLLGMGVAGTSENYGIEQERLNNVDGARLRITTLRASDGPGVELLEYISPRDGRRPPSDARVNDLFHWQTSMVVPDLHAALESARLAGIEVISRDEHPPNAQSAAFGRALIRDPDGHTVELIEQGTAPFQGGSVFDRTVGKRAAREQ